MKQLKLSRTDKVNKIEDLSNDFLQRARVFFKNGCELSVIRGDGTHGGEYDLFEALLMEVPKELRKPLSQNAELHSLAHVPKGYLKYEEVNQLIEKIGEL